jgi:hypothetical protein
MPMDLSDPEKKPGKKMGDRGTGDLFAWGAQQRGSEKPETLSYREPGGARSLYGIERSNDDPPRGKPITPDSYLYSGNGGRLEPAGRDSEVVRNRVMFLILFLGLIIFVAVQMLSK